MTDRKAITKGGRKGSAKGTAEGSDRGTDAAGELARLARNIYTGGAGFWPETYMARVFEQLSYAKDFPDEAGAILFNVFDELLTLAGEYPDDVGTFHEQARRAAYCLTPHFDSSLDALRRGLAEGGDAAPSTSPRAGDE